MLPTVFRPLWARRVIFPLVFLVLLACGTGAIVLPPAFQLLDRLGVLGVGVLVAAFLVHLAAVRIEADDAGITVVNLLRRRRLAWAEVVNLRLAPGDPWLVLALSDGAVLAAMGVQGSDGTYAREQARALGRLVAEHSRTARDD